MELMADNLPDGLGCDFFPGSVGYSLGFPTVPKKTEFLDSIFVLLSFFGDGLTFQLQLKLFEHVTSQTSMHYLSVRFHAVSKIL